MVRSEQIFLFRNRFISVIIFDMNKLRTKRDMLFHEIFQFLEPWVCRRSLCVSKEWNGLINDIVTYIDDRYKQNKHRSSTRCHNAWDLKYPYEYTLVMDHDCTNAHPNTKCHMTNMFGSVHWDITTYGFKPYKCVQCGKVFLSKRIVKKFFFLNAKDISNATRYISSRDYRSVAFDKHEIQWLSLMKYSTTAPRYFPTESRKHREKMIESVLKKISVPVPLTKEALSQTTPFRLYLEGKWKVSVVSIYDRYCKLLGPFMSFYEECEVTYTNMTLFKDMTGLTVLTHGFDDDLRKSYEWFLGESIFSNDVNRGLYMVRSLILEEHKKKADPVLSVLTPYFVMAHSKIEEAEENFKKGNVSLENLIARIELCQSEDRRRKHAFKFLHQNGIHHEALVCKTLSSYVTSGFVSLNVVLRCMKNHINNNKQCIVN